MEQERTLPKFKDDPTDRQDSVVLDRVYLLSLSGPEAGTIFTLNQGTTVVGRVPGADLMLNDHQVSRKHAQFITKIAETTLSDLESTNGTFLNNERITSERELSNGDEIQIGATRFRFCTENPIDGSRLGLRSHGYFENRVGEELDRAHRYERPLSLLMISQDVQGSFSVEEKKKILCDRYPTIVEHLRTMIRTMDLLAHYGKLELEMLLPETNKKEAFRLAQRITSEKVFDRRVYLSVGIATFPEDGRTGDVLIERSRQALKQARANPEERVAQMREDVRRVLVSNQEMIIKSEKMAQLFELAERIAKSMITVLIQGETGVGKEVIAEAIHANSDRGNKPLVCVNCAALTETLLESELFGHEKGSFTGADQTKIGLFESAKGGTIFLDEVGEMPAKTQAKLLRVLQSKKIMRVGSNRELDTDVRIVAATNQKLEDLVARKVFREDLYYRLNAATIIVPPLRERREEIPYLIQFFIEKACQENGVPVRKIAPDAMELLVRYPWPGNIRELKNTMERAVIISEGDTIYREALTSKLTASSQPGEYTDEIATAVATSVVGAGSDIGDMKEIVSSYEKDLILHALQKSNWNQTKAADLLKVPRRTLVSKIKKYEIRRG